MTVNYWIIFYLKWLEPIVLLVGLGIAIWAFLRCRKCGYLAFALYFALAVSLPPINRAIRAYHTPDVSEQTQQKMQAAEKQAVEKVLAEDGYHALPMNRTIYFPFGRILLVVGLWLVARRETHRPNNAPEPTATAP
jgi:hypothetical protein